MDAFSYLSVLLSIILGLAITQILQGYRALLLTRHTVRWSLLPLLWSGLLLLFVTQSWWASFGLRDHAGWSFVAFCIVLLQMALFYMMAAVILPDPVADEQLDLAEHFKRQRLAFFAFFLGVLATSILKDVVLDERLPGLANLVAHSVFALVCVLGMTLKSPRLQYVVALFASVTFASYVWLYFARL